MDESQIDSIKKTKQFLGFMLLALGVCLLLWVFANVYSIFSEENIDTKEKEELIKALVKEIEKAREKHKGYLRAAQNYYGMYPDEPLVKLKSEDEYIAERIIEFLEKHNSSKN